MKIWKVVLRFIDVWKGIDLCFLKEISDDVFWREIVKRVVDFNIVIIVLFFVVVVIFLVFDEIIIGRIWLCEVIFIFN